MTCVILRVHKTATFEPSLSHLPGAPASSRLSHEHKPYGKLALARHSTPHAHTLDYTLHTLEMAPPQQPPPAPVFKTIAVTVSPTTYVAHLTLARGAKSNAIDADMWVEIPLAMVGRCKLDPG